MPPARRSPSPPIDTDNDDVPSFGFFQGAQGVKITGGRFTVLDSDNNITHFGKTATVSLEEIPPEEQSPHVLNINCGNVNETRLENVANQNLHLHLHYTEIYSTPKDGGEPIRTERFDYDMAPGGTESNEQEHKHSLNGVFSRAFDVAGNSKKSREMKKSFKSLLALLQDDLGCDGSANSSTITQEEDTDSDSTEYFSACDAPLQGPSRTFHPRADKLRHSDNSQSCNEEGLQHLPWKETVHDFVNSVTAMSRQAAGLHESDSDDSSESNATPALAQPPPEALPPLAAAHDQTPVFHPALVSIIQDAVCEAVKQQFSELQIGNTSLVPNPTSTAHARSTAQRKSIGLRPSRAPTVYQNQNETWDGQHARSGLEGMWSGRVLCEYREIKAHIPRGRGFAKPIIKERTMGRIVIPLESGSPIGAVKLGNLTHPQRPNKRPRLAQQRDGYEADGDDSDDE